MERARRRVSFQRGRCYCNRVVGDQEPSVLADNKLPAFRRRAAAAPESGVSATRRPLFYQRHKLFCVPPAHGYDRYRMFGTHPKELPQKIAFLLVPNFSMIAFTSAVEPLRLANRVSGRSLYSWHLFSPDGGPIAASNGIALTPEG